jgi:replication-associated recombination protein RarA
MTLLIDTSFQSTYDGLRKATPHAILLHGAVGVGLGTIAKSLLNADAEMIIMTSSQKTKTALPAIGIERIRELYEQVKTTTKQLVIIDNADMMTDAAQNALLKLIEEPNKYTSFILTSHHPEGLLPTVRSRLQAYFIPPVSGRVIADQIAATPGMVQAKKQQITFLAAGLPAELARLIKDDEYFRIRASEMQLAKLLLESTSYDAVAKLMKEKLDRSQAVRAIEDATRLLQRTPTESGVKRIKSLLTAHKSILYGGNPRLHLMRAMI